MASASSDSLMASGGWQHSDSLIASGDGNIPPNISRTSKVMTMKFLPNVGIYQEARDQKFLT